MTAAPATVRVRAIAAGGDGVGTLDDGRTVFIPRAAPGDLVSLRNIRRHARFARADIATLLEPGPDRVAPPCPHYIADRCGGCQLMHLTAAAQRSAKSRIAGDALRRIAHLDIADPDVVPSPLALGYRTKVTFAIRDGVLGYHALNSPTEVFDVRECLLADPRVRRLHAAVRAARQQLPPDDARVVLRLDRAGDLHVLILTGPGARWSGGVALHRALQADGVEAVVWWRPAEGEPRVVAGGDDPWPVTVFEQIHPAMGALVRRAALEALGDIAGVQAWDLYAGTGQTTVGLIGMGAQVASVERDPRAVKLAEARDPAGAQRVAGLVERVAPSLPPPAVVITNPPRIGMAAPACDALLASGAQRIAYISCDAATLARDVDRLASGYRVARLRTFDQFPQTAHLESLAVLERR
jgi:23S rRNA (uracil1939-C5)-methyltransferase